MLRSFSHLIILKCTFVTWSFNVGGIEFFAKHKSTRNVTTDHRVSMLNLVKRNIHCQIIAHTRTKTNVLRFKTVWYLTYLQNVKKIANAEIYNLTGQLSSTHFRIHRLFIVKSQYCFFFFFTVINVKKRVYLIRTLKMLTGNFNVRFEWSTDTTGN